MDTQIEMVEVNLNSQKTPTTPSTPVKLYDEGTDAIQNYALIDEVRVHDPQDKMLEEYIKRHKLAHPPTDDGKPHLRFFAVGPSTYQIRCPLCKQRADAETVQMRGILGQLSCLLSTLSCCFPIFSLSFVYLCLQSRLKSKRLFCNKCGGHLGFFWRPTNPIRWSGRYDLNHYCSECGCYIGRFITLSWYKRQLFKIQQSDVASENKWQRFHKVEKEQLDSKILNKLQMREPMKTEKSTNEAAV